MLTEEQKLKLSPMMQKYLETKEEYPDCILFYRLGDFYEMFFEDALTASKVLEITLTGKECGLDERAPMCGVPYHAVDSYLTKMVQNGYKVAIAEQMEDPKQAKGLVKREVIRVVTPGTITASEALDETRNNYLMCIAYLNGSLGIAVTDVTTGDFFVTELEDPDYLLDEIYRYHPAEIVTNDTFLMSGIRWEDVRNRGLDFADGVLNTQMFDDSMCTRVLEEHFLKSSEELGLSDYPIGKEAAGALMQYLYQTQKTTLAHITTLKTYRASRFMVLDTATRRNLELTETMREKKKRGSLLGVLDATGTAMGARTLRSWIEQPLVDKRQIRVRQDAVEELVNEYISREELKEYLQPIYDLERLIARISFRSANPRDLIAFRNSCAMLPAIHTLLKEFHSKKLKSLRDELDDLQDLKELIEASIVEEPPLLIREGGLIRDGYSEEVDLLRRSKTDGKLWISELEAKEKERTGISKLRIKYNKVFGYYIEITNSFLNQVPDDYIRRQTLTNAERYTTTRLKELEEIIVGAEDRLFSLEYDLFVQLRDRIAGEVDRIQKTAHAIAELDCLVSLAGCAQKNHYVRPQINEKGVIDIKDGRHPVVEQLSGANSLFVANDTYLDNNEYRVDIITGPNMAGKSTYMRQTALIVLMAQIGSFVPASSANIGICDRIFTRVGASDDLASGQSTFMIEMTEVANILSNATKNSLLILDEIGRGTSTYDGMSIAWAVVEYIADKGNLGAKTLFATHYHELTELEGALPGVKNYCIAVKEQGDEITFLRKIMRGGADKSYGIQVARLAGLPEKVLTRAKELLVELSDADITVRARELAEEGAVSKKAPKQRVTKPDEVDVGQLTLFAAISENDIIEEIQKLDLTAMTPIDALNTLYRMQAKLKNRV